MAAIIDGVFNPELQKAILKSKVLVVGAGGIGCEILKNLVMTGFNDIEIVSCINCFLFSLCRVSMCAFRFSISNRSIFKHKYIICFYLL